MKNLLIVLILGLLTASPLFAEDKQEISLRFSRQNSAVRVVLESSENFIKNAGVTESLSNIKIEFPAFFTLKKPNDFIFETVAKDRVLIINLKNITEVRTYKLSSPGRIVIDLKNNQQPPKDQGVLPEKKNGEQPQEKKQIPPVEKSAAPKVFVIDAGHGGYDYGIQSKDTKEKDLNLAFARKLSAALSKKGHKPALTRKADQSLSLLERIMIGSSRNTDIYISLHSSSTDAFALYTATVEETAADAPGTPYSLASRQRWHIEKSRALAKAIGASLQAEFKGTVVMRELPVPVLSSMGSTALLIEYPSLQLVAYDQKMLDRMTDAIVKGIEGYE